MKFNIQTLNVFISHISEKVPHQTGKISKAGFIHLYILKSFVELQLVADSSPLFSQIPTLSILSSWDFLERAASSNEIVSGPSFVVLTSSALFHSFQQLENPISAKRAPQNYTILPPQEGAPNPQSMAVKSWLCYCVCPPNSKVQFNLNTFPYL